ncbi:hypothetical protein APE01nite_21160 [Acetobacter peroxydans]|uniref:Uncharacterized protein n=1 Tax=Acetobacter peroxydans TaxID=104098 RepID=A0A4Y3TXZ8_9PROT|nr:hypothetical protein APE01nite_21160 [Acetobacter peroxydans]
MHTTLARYEKGHAFLARGCKGAWTANRPLPLLCLVPEIAIPSADASGASLSRSSSAQGPFA